MASIEKRSMDSTDDVRPFQAHGRADVVTIGDFTLGRGTFEPGWRWSTDVKPIAGTESCQVRHTGIAVSGQMTVRSDDGTEVTVGPGDVFVMEPGHDAWVVGDEACVMTPGSRHTRNHPGRAGTDHHLSGSSDGKPGNRPAAEAVAGGKAPLTRRQHPLGPLRRTAVKSPP